MKKLASSLSAILLTMTVNSFAITPIDQSNFGLSVPKSCGGLIFGLTALYLTPSLPHLDYALVYPINQSGTVDGVLLQDGSFKSIRPNYEWGIRANLGYVLPCSIYDVNLAYTNVFGSEDDTVRTHRPFTIFSTFFSGTPNNIGIENVLIPFSGGPISVTVPVPIDVAGSTINLKYRVFDFEFGQNLNKGCRLGLRYFGGLRSANLKTSLDASYLGSNSVLGPTGTIGTLTFTTVDASLIMNQRTNFTGVGPRFGFDVNYSFCNGLGLVSEFSGSLLAGRIETVYRDLLVQFITSSIVPVAPPFDPLETVGPLAIVNLNSFKHPFKRQIVPNLEGKVGVSYKYQFCNTSRTTVILEAGWLTTHYFNSFDMVSGVDARDPEFRTRHTIDTSLGGPYFGLQLYL